MNEWLSQLQPWHWIILCLLLLGAEAIGIGGFLLGAAAAAAAIAGFLFFWPDTSWANQLILFAIAAVIFTVAYWRFFRSYNDHTEQPQLNDRAAQLIGRSWVLQQSLPSGESRVQIGDTLWRVRTEQQLQQGIRVEVIDRDGMVLLVRQVIT
ncbi:NfeD family protein [Ferrimonas lipolytica]|uniref:NfeD family protein n=1 Tax=Ferrimonas lipolytica TaxID=2724191 RepID=A0A6H1UJI1_9GAMM|nr:NfeD family protein [Ferrimonas lipolytica]QIZ78376.1 NfeD family protein [Ferrimonas lipolytica]